MSRERVHLNSHQVELLAAIKNNELLARGNTTRDRAEVVALRGIGLVSCARCDGDHAEHRPILTPAGEFALREREIPTI